jgi:hypothetical protein
VTIKEKREISDMLAELESYRLEVALVPQKYPSNVGACNRVAININAQWYRDFCACYHSTRKRENNAHDTKIKRKNVVGTLNAILRGTARSQYVNHFLTIARNRIKRANEKKIGRVEFSSKKILTVGANPF